MIQPVNALTPKVLFGGLEKSKNENPAKTQLEKRLAIANAVGISAILGALTTGIARSYTASWKNAGLFGLGAGAVTMMFALPKYLYRAGFYTKKGQGKIMSSVNEAVDKHGSNLQGKLESYSKTKAKALIA